MQGKEYYSVSCKIRITLRVQEKVSAIKKTLSIVGSPLRVQGKSLSIPCSLASLGSPLRVQGKNKSKDQSGSIRDHPCVCRKNITDINGACGAGITPACAGKIEKDYGLSEYIGSLTVCRKRWCVQSLNDR